MEERKKKKMEGWLFYLDLLPFIFPKLEESRRKCFKPKCLINEWSHSHNIDQGSCIVEEYNEDNIWVAIYLFLFCS